MHDACGSFGSNFLQQLAKQFEKTHKAKQNKQSNGTKESHERHEGKGLGKA